MSTSRGNHIRSRPQKHQNRTAFKNDLHDTSKKTKSLNSLEVSGVCKRCKDIIEWKIKYKKYKALSTPSKCVDCKEKSVKHAYHVLCANCAKKKIVCAKCCKVIEHEEPGAEIEENQNIEIQSILKSLPERKRRTILRFIKKQQDTELPSEILNSLKSKIEEIDLENDFDSLSISDESEHNTD